MVTIWFESHGTTFDNEAKISSGWQDVDLSELGAKQAGEMLERNRGRNLAAIFCSDMQRSLKTAIPTANALHIPVYIDERLRECDYGDMEGETTARIDKERPQRIMVPFPNGESLDGCLKRMEPFYAWLRQNFDGQTVLIIGHKATHYGVEYFTTGRPLQAMVATPWKWQPGWQYQLQ